MTHAASREPLLAALLQLAKRARACTDAQALAFLMVNDTHALAPYRQAALWLPGAGGDGVITALSGLAVPDANAPYTVWLASLLARRAREGASGPFGATSDEQSMWAEHLPGHGLLLRLPMGGANGGNGLLALWRDTPWAGSDTAVLGLLADAYAHAWRALAPTQRPRRAAAWWGRLRHGERRSRAWLTLGAAVVGLMFVPVRQSVLAPAEVVARAPMAVRAPLQGVVDQIAVTPKRAVAGRAGRSRSGRAAGKRAPGARRGPGRAAAEPAAGARR